MKNNISQETIDLSTKAGYANPSSLADIQEFIRNEYLISIEVGWYGYNEHFNDWLAQVVSMESTLEFPWSERDPISHPTYKITLEEAIQFVLKKINEQ